MMINIKHVKYITKAIKKIVINECIFSYYIDKNFKRTTLNESLKNGEVLISFNKKINDLDNFERILNKKIGSYLVGLNYYVYTYYNGTNLVICIEKRNFKRYTNKNKFLFRLVSKIFIRDVLQNGLKVMFNNKIDLYTEIDTPIDHYNYSVIEVNLKNVNQRFFYGKEKNEIETYNNIAKENIRLVTKKEIELINYGKRKTY